MKNTHKTNSAFQLKTLTKALAFALTASAVPYSYAAEEGASEETEVIAVTGIRGSIIKSINEKRFSGDILDSISSEDIGKLS